MNSFDYIEKKIDEYNKFCGKKVILTTVACGVYSASSAYYKGTSIPVKTVWGTMIPALYSTSFFTGAYLLKEFRQSDDAINYGITGSISSGILTSGLTNSIRAGGAAFVVGAVLGSGYKVIADLLYLQAKEMWISNRVYRYENSQHKIIIMNRGRFISSEQAREDSNIHRERKKFISDDLQNKSLQARAEEIRNLSNKKQ